MRTLNRAYLLARVVVLYKDYNLVSLLFSEFTYIGRFIDIKV